MPGHVLGHEIPGFGPLQRLPDRRVDVLDRPRRLAGGDFLSVKSSEVVGPERPELNPADSGLKMHPDLRLIILVRVPGYRSLDGDESPIQVLADRNPVGIAGRERPLVFLVTLLIQPFAGPVSSASWS